MAVRIERGGSAARVEAQGREARAWLSWVLAVLATGLAGIAIRLPLLGVESWDYQFYVAPWYDQIASAGLRAYGENFSNYTPPYLYLLGLATWLPGPQLDAIKTVSIAFDYVLAGAAGWIAWELTRDRRRAMVAAGAVLVAPTVVLNSAAWGQCDAIYAAFLLAGIGAQLRGHSGVAVLLAGCAFAVKLQAVFIAPWFVVLTLRRQLPVRTWLLAPLPYLAAVAPSWLLGRPFGELLMIYPDQADTYGQLTLHAPSVYAWLPLPDSFGRYGVAIGAVILGLAMLACWRRTGRDAEATVAMALFFVILVPWVLPHMHERYFYPADALSIAYAAGRPRMVLVPLLVVSASVFSYLPFLFGVELVPLWFNAGLMAAALVIVAWDTLALPRPPAFAVGARRRLAGEPSA